jgi:hemolysin activation/secretion protein
MRPFLAALLLAGLAPAVRADGPVVPGAGSMLQQVQPVPIPVPSSTRNGLAIEKKNPGPLPPGAAFLVQTIRFSGQTQFATATLHALVADAEGQRLTLSQLGEVAARVADYYHQRGYALAQALIPAQRVQDGVVVIEVIEARYGSREIDNHSRVNPSLLQDTLATLDGGQPISQPGLDHALLLLSDIPGVTVNATLRPGAAFGTADLLVSTTPGPGVTGNVLLDDFGNQYTGRLRLGATVNVNDPLHQGDVLSLSGLSSGRGINYGRLAYETLVNGSGTRLGGSASMLHYQLDGPLSALQAHGTALLASLWAKHPLIRSRQLNLYGQIQYDFLQLRDHLDASAIRTDRRLDNGTLSLAGDAREALLPGGITLWRLDGTAGRVTFDDETARLADAATAKTAGGFLKWNANLVHLQRLGPADGLYLAFTGQWANGNLDSSEKMIAGGPYTVRAYDMGAVSGDEGFLATAEFRHALGPACGSQWQAVAFFDRAQMKINQTAWGPATNRATLSGVGVGLNWVGPRLWSGKLCVATPVGPIPVLAASTASARVWLELSRGF